mmetsp:Transcript_28616/g.42159  ORF Transcript_28616/g.42159 Transcript_28616/m.42159 type:complete len:105 (-) Transcript_28616:231-545(-)
MEVKETLCFGTPSRRRRRRIAIVEAPMVSNSELSPSSSLLLADEHDSTPSDGSISRKQGVVADDVVSTTVNFAAVVPSSGKSDQPNVTKSSVHEASVPMVISKE